MKLLWAVLIFTVAPLSAKDGVDSMAPSSDQLTKIQSMIPLRVPAHQDVDDPAQRPAALLKELEPALVNLEHLNAYLRKALQDGAAVKDSPAEWQRAWRRLDAEEERLKPILAEGESVLGKPGPPPLQKNAPPVDSEEWRRLQRSQDLAVYARGMRDAVRARVPGYRVRAFFALFKP